MSPIIKSALAGERARPVFNRETAFRPPPTEPEIDPALARACAEISHLSSLLGERETEIEALKQAVEEARRQGEAHGRAIGLAEGSQQAEQALAALTDGIGRACEAVSHDTKSLEQLALLVAQAALERVLGPDADQRTLVAEIIARQIELLGAQAILLVEISGKDFAHSDLLELKARISERVEIRATDDIARAGCRIKLRLGSLEVGPRQQWSALSAELSKIAASVSP
jgi:type III secretion protein L